MLILSTVAMEVAPSVAAVSAFTADHGKALVMKKLHGLLQGEQQSGVVGFQKVATKCNVDAPAQAIKTFVSKAIPNETKSSHQKVTSELAHWPLEPYDAVKQYLVVFVHSLFGDDNAALINQIQSCTKRDEFMGIVNECREMVVGIAGKKKADEFVAGILALLPD